MNTPLQIIVTEPGSISSSDKKKLSAKEVVLIEAKDPDTVKILTPSLSSIQGDDLLLSALRGVIGADSSSGYASFTKELYKRLSEKENKK